jgi:hypothetical protein
MNAKPEAAHHWLDQLLGEWTWVGECNMGPDKPPMHSVGTEVVRSLGGLWTIGEGRGEMDGQEIGKTIMSLGYDPETKRYVGTFIGSMMTYMWIYSGSVNEEKTILTLDTEGPNFIQSGMAKYQDIIEFINPDQRTLKSQFMGEDGKWFHFMTATYTRKK